MGLLHRIFKQTWLWSIHSFSRCSNFNHWEESLSCLLYFLLSFFSSDTLNLRLHMPFDWICKWKLRWTWKSSFV